MTDPLGGQSAAPGTGQSAGDGIQGTGTALPAGGQSAPGGTTGAPPTDAGQSAVTREEFDRLRAQLQAADQKRTKAEQDLAQLRDKDMPELQRLQRDLQTSQAAVTERDGVISNLRVENSFLTDNTHAWHDPAAALKLLDRSKITVDADGNVTGMKDALKALATANPWLLKATPPEGGGTGTPPAAPPPPGTTPTNGGISPQQGSKPNQDELARRFPALRQRLG